MTDDNKLDRFADAFFTGGSGCRRECHCGRQFYNPNGGWTWEEGELEELEADQKATCLDWPVGTLMFEGKEFVLDCDCWHERAKKIMAFLDSHAHKIAEYLNNEKKAARAAADAMPEVIEEPTE